MRNLLLANFARLKRSRLFWLVEAGIFAWGVFAYYMLKINIGNGYPYENGNTYFFNVMTFIGITIACFSSFFIGTEYSDGTMRNKLIVGHGRAAVYFANLITVVCVGFAQFAAYILAALTGGTALVGDLVWSRLYRPAETLGLVGLSICMSAVIAVLISMLIIDKPRAVFLNVLVSVFVLAAGASAVKGLMQPEMTQRAYIPEVGAYQYYNEGYEPKAEILPLEEVQNPKYLRGTERKVYEWISAVLPTSQALLCAWGEDERLDRFSARNVIGTFLAVSVISGCGILAFRKRDLK